MTDLDSSLFVDQNCGSLMFQLYVVHATRRFDKLGKLSGMNHMNVAIVARSTDKRISCTFLGLLFLKLVQLAFEGNP